MYRSVEINVRHLESLGFPDELIDAFAGARILASRARQVVGLAQVEDVSSFGLVHRDAWESVAVDSALVA